MIWKLPRKMRDRLSTKILVLENNQTEPQLSDNRYLIKEEMVLANDVPFSNEAVGKYIEKPVTVSIHLYSDT